MSTTPITTRLFKGAKKTGSKKLDSGSMTIAAPDGARPIKSFGRNKLFNNAPTSPLNK